VTGTVRHVTGTVRHSMGLMTTQFLVTGSLVRREQIVIVFLVRRESNLIHNYQNKSFVKTRIERAL